MIAIAQVSDIHLDGSPERARRARAVMDRLRRARAPLDAILVTGDLAEHAAREEYELAAELVGAAGVPFHVLPGNKDDRATMRDAFDLPGVADAPLDYAADLGPLRLAARLDLGEPALLSPSGPRRGHADRTWSVRMNVAVEPDL